ncbi:GerMN domain-containing protein [Agromyces arachidis]|uniref:GerMN domain-containing protein n=1 Tax=Agromyces arachidis TaxID=766966 RepID=UPI004057AA50
MGLGIGRSAAAVVAAASLLLAGCTGAGPIGPTASPSSGPSATAPPSSSPPSSSPPASTGPSSTPTPQVLTVYFVRIGDDGASGERIGCGDSLVPVTTPPIATDDPLRASIVRLLETPEGEVVSSGLHTAVPGGTLDYVDGRAEGDTVTVELTGEPLLRGECEDPRIRAQLERTAMSATGASEALILIDGVPIEEFLDLD